MLEHMHRQINVHLGELATVLVRWRTGEPIMSAAGVLGLKLLPEAVDDALALSTLSLAEDDALEAEHGYYTLNGTTLFVIPHDAEALVVDEGVVVFAVYPVEIEINFIRPT
jgi:hypothetical protein